MTTYLELPTYQQRSVREVREFRYGLAHGAALSLLMWVAIVFAAIVLR